MQYVIKQPSLGPPKVVPSGNASKASEQPAEAPPRDKRNGDAQGAAVPLVLQNIDTSKDIDDTSHNAVVTTDRDVADSEVATNPISNSHGLRDQQESTGPNDATEPSLPSPTGPASAKAEAPKTTGASTETILGEAPTQDERHLGDFAVSTDQISQKAGTLAKPTATAGESETILAYPKTATSRPDLRVRITNPMVNVAYDFRFPDGQHKIYGAWFLVMPDATPMLECAGMHYSANPARLEGTPQIDGNVTLRVVYEERGGYVYADSNFYVNKNPRDMWIPLEPEDGADLSWKHHRDARRLLADRQAGSSGWDLYGASIRGRAHAKEAKYREDDFALGRGNSSSPWHVLVSCDGAGSASLSRYGSALVAKSVASFLITRLEQPPPQLCVPDPSGPSEDGVDTNISAYPVSLHQLDSGFHHVFESPNLYDELAMRDLFRNLFRSAAWDAVDAIAKEAQRVARPEKDFNSTLLIVLFRQHPVSQKALVATFQIGDGAIGIGVPNDSKMNWKVFGTPDSGQFAGETIFLSRRVLENEDALADRTRVTWFDSMPIVFAMSDGVSDPRFPSEASLDEPDGWQTLWGDISPTLPVDWSERESDAWIEKLYAVLDRYDEGHHDDRTIVIARPTMSAKDAERHG